MLRTHARYRHRTGTLALWCALTALTAGTVHASGGYGGTSVYGTPRTGSFDTDVQSSYNRGKSLYERRLACPECPLAGVSLDEVLARDLLTNKRGVTLTHEEAYALDLYLKRRFRL